MPTNALSGLYPCTIESYGPGGYTSTASAILRGNQRSQSIKLDLLCISWSLLEWLRPRLEFEERVEGRVSQPYLGILQELIARQEAENLRDRTMICFYEKVGELYGHWIETATSSQHVHG